MVVGLRSHFLAGCWVGGGESFSASRGHLLYILLFINGIIYLRTSNGGSSSSHASNAFCWSLVFCLPLSLLSTHVYNIWTYLYNLQQSSYFKVPNSCYIVRRTQETHMEWRSWWGCKIWPTTVFPLASVVHTHLTYERHSPHPKIPKGLIPLQYQFKVHNLIVSSSPTSSLKYWNHLNPVWVKPSICGPVKLKKQVIASKNTMVGTGLRCQL